MPRMVSLVVASAVLAAACGGSPTTPVSPSRMARLSRTRFAAFGDSLTTGEVTAPVVRELGFGALTVVATAAYPTVLESLLQTAYPAQASSITVSNQGLGGETIVDGALRFEQVFAHVGPEVVIIQEGVNGLAAVGVTSSTALMRSMVREARNGQARVYVGSMLPTLPNRQRSQNVALLVAYNDALRAMCVEEGATFVDLYNGMMPSVEQWIGTDGLHPNEAGYRKIADLFFEAIRSTLEDR